MLPVCQHLIVLNNKSSIIKGCWDIHHACQWQALPGSIIHYYAFLTANIPLTWYQNRVIVLTIAPLHILCYSSLTNKDHCTTLPLLRILWPHSQLNGYHGESTLNLLMDWNGGCPWELNTLYVHISGCPTLEFKNRHC